MPTPETRRKISETLKGRTHSTERRDAIAKGRRIRYPVIQVGQVFGEWTVIGDPINQHNQMKYMCRCSCGRENRVAATHLRRGNSSQCVRCAGKSNSALSFDRNKSSRGRWIYSGSNGRARRPWILAAFTELLEKQAQICPVCLRYFNKSLSDACIDHDHATGEMRGVVHTGCNVLIGWFERFPEIDKRINSYIGAHK